MNETEFSGKQDKPNRQHLIFLSILIVLKILVHVYLNIRGFISVSADEFARGISAAQWALTPSFDLLSDVNLTWLPFEKYLNGLLMILWPEPYWVPRITVFLFSIFTLIILFELSNFLFENLKIAALTCLFVIFIPWFAWLSSTPMLEIYYQAFFFGGFLFLCLWFYKGKKYFWLWAALCFILASSAHVQAWLQINSFFIITLYWMVELLKRKDIKKIIELISVFFISNLLILLIMINAYIKTGNPIDYFSRHTEYSRWFYQGYPATIFERLSYYPKLVIESSSFLYWGLLILSIILLLKGKYNWRFFIPLSLALLSLFVTSLFNIFSVPATAAPNRYSLFFLLLLTPYVGFIVYRVIKAGIQTKLVYKKSLLLLMGIFSIFYLVVMGSRSISKFPGGLSKDSIKAGYYINEILDSDPARFMLELKYWEFLAVQMTAGHYSEVVFDREYILTERDKVSVLLNSKEDIDHIFESQEIQYLIIQDPDLKNHIDLCGNFNTLSDIGNWRILKYSP